MIDATTSAPTPNEAEDRARSPKRWRPIGGKGPSPVLVMALRACSPDREQ